MTAPLAAPVDVAITRLDLVRYAGAANDLNAIHWSDAAASAAGLPAVIAQGMLLMGIAVRVATELCGPDILVTACDTRFVRPFPVPVNGTAVLTVTASVSDDTWKLVGTSDGAVVLTGQCQVRHAKGAG